MPKIEAFVRQCIPWIFAIILSLSLRPYCDAQTSSAALSVNISDSTGAVIAAADVSLQNADTTQEQHEFTGKSGAASFSFLKPGHYSLKVSKDSFADVAVRNIVLNVGDEKQLQLVLKVGTATDTVSVDGSGPTINTTDASVGTIVDRHFVENIPLNGRSFQELILMTPGVVTQSPQTNQANGTSGDFSVNGQRTETNYYTVDGISANNNPGLGLGPNSGGNVPSSTALGTTQSVVSVDALEEFRISSSTYSAEYGRSPGGQISFVTRSGTKELHGSVFDYLRNNYFDANDWFSNYYGTASPALRQNDFGGTLGGPILLPHIYERKDKTFFFFSYEGLRLTQPQPASLQYVPDTSLRQNATPALQPVLNAFPVQNGSEAQVPCTQGATSAYPCPTGSPTGTLVNSGLAQFIQQDSLPSAIDSVSVRLDHSLSSRAKLFFRFSDSPSNTSSRALSLLMPVDSTNQSYTVGLTLELKPNLTNEFRAGFTGSGIVQKAVADNFGGAQPVNIPSVLGASGSNATAVLELVFGGNFSLLNSLYGRNHTDQWNVTDSVSWLLGHHNVKLGIDYRHLTSRSQRQSSFVEYVYYNADQLLTNQAVGGIGEVYSPGVPVYYTEFSAFLQDEWKPTPKLIVSPGLRWELNPAPGAKDNDLPYTVTGNLADPASLAIAPKGAVPYQTTYYNFAPRLGIAWIANTNPEYQTVLRAGTGVFFAAGNDRATLGYNGLGYAAEKIIYGAAAPFPGGVNQTNIPITLAAPYTSAPLYYSYPHLQLPYTIEWNVALEQALRQSQSLTISYVGASGRRLLQAFEYSLLGSNPNFNTIYTTTNGNPSNYQALEVKLQRSVAHGLHALVSYTWSHSIDYESSAVVFYPSRGNSDFDVRNNFTTGATWDIPASSDNRLARMVLGHWALDGHFIARTAFPVTLQGSTFLDPATGNVSYTGVSLVSGEPIYLHVQGIPGNRELNPQAFQAPTSGNGDAPRNFARGFGATQLNIAARREFPIFERARLQFRAEAFNLLNHPSFGYINPILGSSTFGQTTETLNQSLTTLSPLYQMGGPRSMQFSLKVQF